jgi:hypothetical protein
MKNFFVTASGKIKDINAVKLLHHCLSPESGMLFLTDLAGLLACWGDAFPSQRATVAEILSCR